jgi:hypothetical protein
MTKWEYLFLTIEGHNVELSNAGNMLVTTSDGRWRRERMPKNVFGIVHQLGEEGWEMVNCSGGKYMPNGYPVISVWPTQSFEAVFKRPK